jgi:hypothetical protein
MSEENLNVHSNLSESEIPVESKETDPQSIESAVSSDITSSLENVEPEGTDFDIHPELENSVEASSELEPVAQVVSEISQDSETNEEVESVTTPIPDGAESAPIVAEDTEESLLGRIDELRKSIDSDIYLLDQNYDAVENAQDRRERVLTVTEEFKDWVGARQASYAWKLMDKLRGYQDSLSKDEKSIRDFVAEENSLEFGFSEKTRKWFMKRFMTNFYITWGLILVLYLLHRYASQIAEWVTQNVSNEALRTFLTDAIVNIIGPGFWRIAAYILLASFAHFVGLLFAYSRRMSEYSRHVAVESARTKAMDDGVHKVREARERLDSLHPQVPQILELLSLGLHQPWKLREEDLLFTASVPDASLMPASVEISVPTISKSSPIYEELVFKTMNEIQIAGWRESAFSSIISRISNSLGFGQNGMALREIDEDQRRSGKRELILKSAGDESPFREIGAELLEKFTAITQEKIIPTVQPQVVSLKPDPLANLELSGTLLPEDSESVSKWEEKLSEIAGHAAPWSSGTFSVAGASAKKHLSLESIFLASERVQGLAATEVEAHAEVRPGSRPFEVAIRVDLSEWCKPFEVAIFEDYVPSNEQLQRWNQAENEKVQSENTSNPPTSVDGAILL